VNQRLVMCLFAAILVGLAAAAGAVSAGWHPALVFAVYSLTGSCGLVGFAAVLAALPERAPAAEDRLPLPAPQST
jgi:predicted secreted Zn-dependent protease